MTEWNPNMRARLGIEGEDERMHCIFCDCSLWNACEDPRMPTGNCAWLVPYLCTACVYAIEPPGPFELVPAYPLLPLELFYGNR